MNVVVALVNWMLFIVDDKRSAEGVSGDFLMRFTQLLASIQSGPATCGAARGTERGRGEERTSEERPGQGKGRPPTMLRNPIPGRFASLSPAHFLAQDQSERAREPYVRQSKHSVFMCADEQQYVRQSKHSVFMCADEQQYVRAKQAQCVHMNSST